jgi:hypothetical protein
MVRGEEKRNAGGGRRVQSAESGSGAAQAHDRSQKSVTGDMFFLDLLSARGADLFMVAPHPAAI